MKDIFSELYKKVLSFFNQEQKEENSKDTACNRLKLVLMQDRAKMEPALMEKMREEMIEVISKYVEIDKDALDLNLEAEGDSFALMLNIPVLRAKTREEIEAAEGIVKDDDDDEDEESIENEDDESEDETESDDTEDNENAENDEVSEAVDSGDDEVSDVEADVTVPKSKIELVSEEELIVESDIKTENILPKSESINIPSKKKTKPQKDEDI